MTLRQVTTCVIFLALITRLNIATAEVLIPNAKQSDKILLNGNWRFKYLDTLEPGSDSVFYSTMYNDSGWSEIKVPGNWELQGFARPRYGKELQEGIGLYRTSFYVPKAWKKKPVYIAFDGVLYGYEFWINGQYVGKYNSAFNRKIFEISTFVKAGKPVQLAVKVSTRSRGWAFDTNDCWSLSGIFRDVTLFTLPVTHLKDLTVKTEVNGPQATIKVAALIETNKFTKRQHIKLTLRDANGQIAATANMDRPALVSPHDSLTYYKAITLHKANMWTSETPYLYTLQVEVTEDQKVLQTYNQKIGIREISWADGVYKINGQVVKLRGVNHHDLSPVNGRAITEGEMLEDLKLIREGNANFIRAAHYPPHPRFMDLCDSLGFYIIDEVPFGFGDKNLYSDNYLPDLKERARATIARDKNHPSVIAWSVGNENPLTKICIETGRYVKKLDATRPYSFPQVGSYFRKIYDTIPADIDILSPHYPVPSHLKMYVAKMNRPMIITEYAHALGLDTDRLEALWEIMYSNRIFAGGAVWHLFDQGILVTSDTAITTDEFTTSVWLDSVTCYDNFGNKGADGLTYANRIPHEDYYEMRKVYTPVKALDDTLTLYPGKTNRVNLALSNRYNFTNLNQIACRWELWADKNVLTSENLPLNGAPHDTAHIAFDVKMPDLLEASFYTLKLHFADKTNYTFYEKSYPLRVNGYKVDLSQILRSKSKKNTSVIDIANGLIQLNTQDKQPVVLKGAFARMSRVTTMSEITIVEKKAEGHSPIWAPHLMAPLKREVVMDSTNKKEINYCFERGDVKGQYLDAQIGYSLNNNGQIDVNYTLTPRHAKGIALEAGLSFIVPQTLTEFRWVGKGPYAAYPGKSRLAEFGIYHLNAKDLFFQGNRQQVDLALITDKNGNGFAMIADKANVSIERSDAGVVISHNAKISGRFNKNAEPEIKVRIPKLTSVSGQFSLIPITSHWSDALQNIFGQPNNTAKPFAPFYNSYDQ